MKTFLAKCAVYAALAIAPVVDDARAEYRLYDSGNDLFGLCTTSESDDVHYLKDSECRGYIVGVVDHLSMWRDTLDFPACGRAGITKGQMVAVVVKYMMDHPETRHEPANELVMKAFNTAFCPKE